MNPYTGNELTLWWKSLSDLEKKIYKYPADFEKLVARHIPRYSGHYSGNLWAVRSVIEKVLGTQSFPGKLDQVNGRKRIMLFGAIAAWATIKDMEDSGDDDNGSGEYQPSLPLDILDSNGVSKDTGYGLQEKSLTDLNNDLFA